MNGQQKKAVWEFFDEALSCDINGKICKKIPCKLYDQLLADGGGTSNLLNHLQAKHPEEFKRCTDSGTQSTSKQSTLSSIRVRCSAQRSASITDRLVDFVTMDLRLLSTVEGKGFKRLLNHIEPGYTVPSRTYITNMCRRKYLLMKEQLLATLQAIPYVAVTSDIWTSRVTQAYITLTVHFITDDWKMESKVIQTEEIPERHTGENISLRLTNVSEQWCK